MATILIVDDEPVELAVFKEVLSEEGFELETASNGLEAQKKLQHGIENLRAILLDWMMPEMTGIELLKWLKEEPDLRNIEVVLQSGRLAPEDAQKCIEGGAYYYLPKPTEVPQLRAVMRAAVSNCDARLSLLQQIRKTEDAFKLLHNGLFRFKTLEEAESLAVGIAATCATCQRALGLFELMVNAVEHGNLGITYDEKSQLLEEGTYDQELRRRLGLKENRDKNVEVSVERSPHGMQVIIKDQGPGFDFKKYLVFDRERLFHTHGRGIFLANSMLTIEYVEPGNQVRIDIPTLPASSAA